MRMRLLGIYSGCFKQTLDANPPPEESNVQFTAELGWVWKWRRIIARRCNVSHPNPSEATTIPPTADRESALVQTLAPGNHTAIVRGKADTTGVGLVEVYHLDE
jgi:hypothetical protein